MGLKSLVHSIVSHVTYLNLRCLLKSSLSWSHLQISLFQRQTIFSEIDFAPPPSRGGAITPSVLRRACTRDGAGRCDGQKGIVDVAVVDQLKARTRKCRLDKGSHLPGNPVQSLWNINNQSMYKYMLNG